MKAWWREYGQIVIVCIVSAAVLGTLFSGIVPRVKIAAAVRDVGHLSESEALNAMEGQKPPELSGIGHRSIRTGERFIPMEGVHAEDGTGRDLTHRIQIYDMKTDRLLDGARQYPTTGVGKYLFQYVVMDGNGLLTKKYRFLLIND